MTSSRRLAKGKAGREVELRDFSRSLPMALMRARESVMARFRPMLRDHELTEQQWRVLRALTASSTPLRFSDIAAMTSLSLPSLSRLLKALEGRGVVKRATHETDLRAAQVSLSAKGRTLVARVAPKSEAIYAQIADALGARHLDDLHALLDAVESRLAQHGEGASSGVGDADIAAPIRPTPRSSDVLRRSHGLRKIAR